MGQTTCHLKHRVAEHLGVSHLTGRPVRSPPHSSIRDHCRQCQGADCSIKNFRVLASASTSLELLIKERLLIERRHPSLNGNSGALELLLYKVSPPSLFVYPHLVGIYSTFFSLPFLPDDACSVQAKARVFFVYRL